MKPGQLIIFSVFALLFLSLTDDKPAYKLYDGTGNPQNYSAMLEAAKKADVVFFGEVYDNPIGHWLELELTKDLYMADSATFKMGAEMLENDNQVVLDEYLKGYYNETTFKDNSRLWPNYSSDYRPLVQFAKEHHVPFIASNIPRRYASMVSTKGLDFLQQNIDKAGKSFIAPLPIAYDSTLKCYADMLTMNDPGHSSKYLPQAQAIKDATMAYKIGEACGKNHSTKFLHFNGAYHSNRYQGICWYLKKYRPDLKIMTISTVEQDDLNKLETDNQDLADFTICVKGE